MDLAEATNKLEEVKKEILKRQDERDGVQRQLKHTTSAEECVNDILVEMDNMETKVQEYEMAVEDCDDAQNRLDAVEHDLDGMRGKKEVQERQL